MPYKINYIRKKKCYSVVNPVKKRIFSKCTTKKNAIKQSRLLRALQFNKNFIPNSSRSRKLGTSGIRLRKTARK